MDNKSYIAFSNVSEVDQAIFSLAKRGYGSVGEIREWDTPLFLDAIEFENICCDIENHEINSRK